MKAWRKYNDKCWKKNSRAVNVYFDRNTLTFIPIRNRLHMIVRALKVQEVRKMVYITSKQVGKVLGCKQTKACEILKACNAYTRDKGFILPGRGKAYIMAFCHVTGLPKKDVLEALEVHNDADGEKVQKESA